MNILENTNLDKVGAGTSSNSETNSLQLNKQRISNLINNGNNPNNPPPALAGSRWFCGTHADNCSDASCQGNIFCGNVLGHDVLITSWSPFTKDDP